MKIWIKPGHKYEYTFSRIFTGLWTAFWTFMLIGYIRECLIDPEIPFGGLLFGALFLGVFVAVGIYFYKGIGWVEKEDDKAAIEIKIKDDQGREIDNPELIKAIAQAVAKKAGR